MFSLFDFKKFYKKKIFEEKNYPNSNWIVALLKTLTTNLYSRIQDLLGPKSKVSQYC